ncbi:hypothetical protein C1645_828796 [Glomus cerebriforme]|uniref:Crinkler effector protein N-terminal domain-containing protein n=1 Tax=Glomus cerebriforme TaxID=658196 RepID=A0A397SM69_9GLOM|nr:hypothetical protein C1645_828796 [Glomus cerebriforme]
MSIDNIIDIIQSLSNESNKLSEDETANLYVYLLDRNTKLADVEKLLGLCMTNNAKLVFLRGISKFIGEGDNKNQAPKYIAEPAEPKVIEFWKRLNEAKIIFLWSQDMQFSTIHYEVKEETNLKFDLRPTVEQSLKNNKYIIQKESIKHNILQDLLSQSDEFEDNCRAILCLPKDVLFLGDENFGSQLLIRNCYLQLICQMFKNSTSQFGCVVTGTPGIGKTYFGLFLLFYIRLYHSNSTVVWQLANSQFGTCICFFPDGDVKIGHFNCFRSIINKKENFYLVDAQVPEGSCAYTILLTSPKPELFNRFIKPHGVTKYYMPIWEHDEIIILWDACYKDSRNLYGKRFTLEKIEILMSMWGTIPRSVLENWDDESYNKKELTRLINETDLEKCMKSINEASMTRNSASSRLVHIHVEPNFVDSYFQFASSIICNKLINSYEHQLGNNLCDLIACNDNQSKIASYRGNLFEDFAHKQLSKGGVFRTRKLKKGINTTEITNKKIKGLEYNWFTTMKNVREDCYNRPRSKIFETIDSFSLDDDNETLTLYQTTVSTNHGIKVKGLKDFKYSKWDEISNKFIKWDKKFHLYYVVPTDKFETFPWQSYRTKKNYVIKKYPSWIDEIPQYVLEIKLDKKQTESLKFLQNVNVVKLFNLGIWGDTSFDNVFSIEIDGDNTRIANINVSRFKRFILNEIKGKLNINDPSVLKLWKVDINQGYKLDEIKNDDDIEHKLSGRMMGTLEKLGDEFNLYKMKSEDEFDKFLRRINARGLDFFDDNGLEYVVTSLDSINNNREYHINSSYFTAIRSQIM